MGNQCCAATNVAPEQGTSTTNPPTNFDNTQYEDQQNDHQHQQNKQTPQVHAHNPQIIVDEVHKTKEEQLQQVNEQKNEDEENQREINEYVFRRQLDTLKKALEKANSLKDIADNGKILTKAISQVELVLQLLSQSLLIPTEINDFKTELTGLYGDLQNFRAFHLRYILDNKFYFVLPDLTELANFFKQVYNKHQKDLKPQFDLLFQDLLKGESNQQFVALKVKFQNIRDIYNQIAGKNLSTLPNYLYLNFVTENGFKLWTQLFPHSFEVSNITFSSKYAQACGIPESKVLDIISLLDNANDKRVDIYQWIGFVKDFGNHLDEECKIYASEIDTFQKEIQNKTRAQKSHPVKNEEEGHYVYKSGMIFKGTLDDEFKRQGNGILSDEDYKFEGEFKDDLPVSGIENRKNVKYQGVFQNGLYHGQGILTFPNGRSYTGSFDNHEFHGQGELTGDDGIKYSGNWTKGVLKVGKITYHDGTYYQGELDNSFFKHGTGALYVYKPNLSAYIAGAQERLISYIEGRWNDDAPKSGKVYNLLQESICYDGELSNWAITGRGKRMYVDGAYDGELLRDKKHNKGTLTYKNGDKFEGIWLNDTQQNGKYTYSKENNHFYEGQWENGVMSGRGKFSYTSGGIYEGEVKEGKRHGYGVYKYSNGNTYEGNWVDNNQQGEGTFTYASGPNNEGGDVYRGEFIKGKFHGFGHYYYKKSGKQYIGNWQDDKWNGEGKFFLADGKILKCGIWANDKLETQKVETDIRFDEPKQKRLIMTINHQPTVAAAPAPQH